MIISIFRKFIKKIKYSLSKTMIVSIKKTKLRFCI